MTQINIAFSNSIKRGGIPQVILPLSPLGKSERSVKGLPPPSSNPPIRVISLLKGRFLAQESCLTRRAGLTPQILESALIPLVRLVRASYHLPRKGLDGGRNDTASLVPFGAVRCSTTRGFSSGYLPGLHPDISLVAGPSRGHELTCQRAENSGYHGNHLYHPLHPTRYFHKTWRAGQKKLYHKKATRRISKCQVKP